MKKTLFSLILFLGLLVLFLGCSIKEKHEITLGLGSFDLTPDGQSIIYTFRKSERMLIYKSNIDGTQIRLLVGDGIDMQYYNPRISEDGEKLVFVGSRGKSVTNSIFTCNIDGNNLEKLTADSAMIIEAIFSLNSDSVYFTEAGEYKNYSPVAAKAPHKFDIYRITLKDKSISKRTHEGAYSMYNLCDVDSNRWLLNLNMDGCFFYNKNGSDMEKIVTTTDTLNQSRGYFIPNIIDRENILVFSQGRLAIINHRTKLEKKLLFVDRAQFGIIRYNKKLKRIFYTIRDESNIIHSVNMDGTGMKDIAIVAAD